MLTLDLGNSTLDIAYWGAHAGRTNPGTDAPLERWTLPADEELAARLEATLAGHPGAAAGELAALSSVHSIGRTEVVEIGLRSLGWELLSPPDPGLEVACRTPWTVGQDRLFTARAAFAQAPHGAIVLDAGTALTVDAVVPAESAASAGATGRGVFRGGAIAPGPALLARALASGGARLPQIEPRPGARALGRDTAEALEAGVVVGFRGAARALLEDIEAELGADGWPGPEAPALFLTGGAAGFLTDPEPFVARELHVSPLLVHHGLLGAGLEAARG